MPKLPPSWSTGAAAVAYLFTLPAMMHVYASQIQRAGYDYVIILMSVWIVFPALMLPVFFLLTYLLRRIQPAVARLALLLSCAGAVLAWHGMPGLWAIGFGIYLLWHIHRETVKKYNNANALEQFDSHGS